MYRIAVRTVTIPYRYRSFPMAKKSFHRAPRILFIISMRKEHNSDQLNNVFYRVA